MPWPNGDIPFRSALNPYNGSGIVPVFAQACAVSAPQSFYSGLSRIGASEPKINAENTMSASAQVAPELDIDSEYAITPQQIAEYQKNGFIKLKNVLSPQVLAHYGREISAKVQELNVLKTPMEQRNTYQKAFLQVSNIWTHSDVVKEFVFSKRLGRIATRLMRCRGVRMYHDQALYKEPGGGITPWHADQYYWPLATDNTTTAWIPLQATPLELGPLAMSAGSQRFNAVGRDLEISDESEVKLSKALLESGLPLNETPFDLGEVSFHMGWTFHRAGPNKSNRPREVMTIIYVDADAKVAEPANKNQLNDLKGWLPGLKPGDAIDSPLNPLIYAE
jgi:ectoine hydroxylase-related dioxygenase (phytanoyl-CoA dioxygenase family)